MKYKTAIVANKFKEDIVEIPEDKLCVLLYSDYQGRIKITGTSDELEIRDDGDFAKKSVFLPNRYNWTIAKDSMGQIILIPTEKDEHGD